MLKVVNSKLVANFGRIHSARNLSKQSGFNNPFLQKLSIQLTDTLEEIKNTEIEITSKKNTNGLKATLRNTAIISATLGVLCDERINMNPKWVIGFGILGLGSSSVLDIANDLSLLGPESRLSELKKKKIELISHINDKEQGF